MQITTRKNSAHGNVVGCRIVVDQDEIEEGMATPMEVAGIEVRNNDGSSTFFSVGLRHRRGRAACEILADKGERGTVIKRVVGSKK